MKDLRIIFMGTPHFAVGVLKTLVEKGFNIVGVITAPDKPAGRGRSLSQSAVKQYALSENLPLLQPTNLKDEAFIKTLKKLQANLQIVVAFRMLPKIVWQIPKYGTFNLHASLLPKYRGAAPINWAIINGEKETGVTTFFIDDKIDTGAILASEKTTIESTETFESLHNKLLNLGSSLVLKTVTMIENGEAIPKPQPKTEAFKEAPKLTTENTRIDWCLTALEIDCFIRGLSPYPAAWTELHQNNEVLKVKVYAATYIIEKHELVAGTIFSSKKELKVAVQDGYLIIKEIQLPGKKKLDVKDLLNGFQFENEAHFS